MKLAAWRKVGLEGRGRLQALAEALAMVMLAAVPALASTAACAAAPTPLAVSFTATPEFGAIFIAQEEGYFARHGLEVKLQLITVSPNVPAAVMSDSVQIGGTTPPVLLQAVDSGLDLVAVAGGGVYERKSKGVGLIARQGLGIVKPSDLIGKKVGVPGFNATIHLLVRKWLMDGGVDPKKVSFVEVPIPQMADVLKGGNVDAVATAEPFVTRIVQGQIGTPVTAFADGLQDGFASVLYISTRRWATANAATVKAFRDALGEAIVFGNAHHDKAYDDIGKYFKVPPAVLRATPWPNWVSTLTDEPLRFWVDTMRTQDMLKKQPMLGSIILK